MPKVPTLEERNQIRLSSWLDLDPEFLQEFWYQQDSDAWETATNATTGNNPVKLNESHWTLATNLFSSLMWTQSTLSGIDSKIRILQGDGVTVPAEILADAENWWGVLFALLGGTVPGAKALPGLNVPKFEGTVASGGFGLSLPDRNALFLGYVKDDVSALAGAVEELESAVIALFPKSGKTPRKSAPSSPPPQASSGTGGAAAFFIALGLGVIWGASK